METNYHVLPERGISDTCMKGCDKRNESKEEEEEEDEEDVLLQGVLRRSLTKQFRLPSTLAWLGVTLYSVFRTEYSVLDIVITNVSDVELSWYAILLVIISIHFFWSLCLRCRTEE